MLRRAGGATPLPRRRSQVWAAPVGVGRSSFQSEVAFHTLCVNAVDQGRLENLPGWLPGVTVRNRHVLVSDEPVTTIRITADTPFDGAIFDDPAPGDSSSPTARNRWGRSKSLHR